jgi:hypothetical protein
VTCTIIVRQLNEVKKAMTGTVRSQERIEDSSPAASADIVALDDRIRRRAHEIWLQPDIKKVSAQKVWLQAEEEVKKS